MNTARTGHAFEDPSILGCLGAFLGLHWAVFEPFWGHLGLFCTILGPSWAVLGLSWGRPGPSWVRVGSAWALLGGLGAILGPSWAVLGACWSRLGSLGAMGRPRTASFGTRKDLLEKMSFSYRKTILSRLRGFRNALEMSRKTSKKRELGASWAILGWLGAILGDLGAIWELFGSHLEATSGILGPSGRNLWGSGGICGVIWRPLREDFGEVTLLGGG
jgi:hypothetical protein